jgi:hypothetical protein
MIFFAVLIVMILGFLVPGILLSTIYGEFSINFVLMWFLVIWCVGRLAYMGLKGKRRLTLMLFYVFIYVFMGVQPLLSIWSNTFPHSELISTLTSNMISFCIFVMIIGVAGFEAGYYRVRKQICEAHSLTDPLRIIRKKHRVMSVNWLWLLSIALTFLFALTIMKFGPNAFLGSRDGGLNFGEFQGPETSSTENTLFIFGLRGLAATLLFVTIYFWKIGKIDLPHYNKRKLKRVFIYVIIINLIISNPLNAPRLWSGAVLLTSLFLSLKWRGSRSFLTWSSIACLGMLLLFSGLDPRLVVSRQLVNNGEITLSGTTKQVALNIGNLPGDYNFDAFQMIFYTTVYTEKNGYSLGNQLLLPAFFWVPRSIWSRKPIGTPDIVAAHANFDSLNVSSPLWSEGYINFGIPGVFLFLFLFGRAARLGDNVLANLTVKPLFSTIISSFFAANTFILLRGDLTSGTMYFQMIALFVFIYTLIGKINMSKMKSNI